MLQPSFAVFFSVDCWKKTSLLQIKPPSPNHSAVKKKGKKKWRQLWDFTVLQVRTHQLCFVSCTALPYLDHCFSPHPLLNCLAQLHSCPPRLPALSAIRESSHIPNPNTLSEGNYSAGTTTSIYLVSHNFHLFALQGMMELKMYLDWRDLFGTSLPCDLDKWPFLGF